MDRPMLPSHLVKRIDGIAFTIGVDQAIRGIKTLHPYSILNKLH